MAILISAGADSAAYRLEQLLKPQVNVCFVDYLPLPQHRTERRSFIQIPKGDSPIFAHSLLALCLDYDILEIYPLRKEELLPIAQSIQLFSEFGIDVFVPPADILSSLFNLPQIEFGKLFVLNNGKAIIGDSKVPGMLKECSGIFAVDKGTGSFSLFTVN